MHIKDESKELPTRISSLDVPRLSWEQFDELARNHATSLAEVHDSLHWIYSLFKVSGSGLRPVQCRQAIRDLYEIREKVEHLCKWLNSDSIPIVVQALRHRLLLTLHHVEKQIDDLTNLINDHRLVCMRPSQSSLQQRKEISRDFDLLLVLQP